MNEQLPIKQIFRDGIRIPFKRYKQLIRLGWPYAILILGSSFIPELTEAIEVAEAIALNLVYGFLFCVTGILGIVGCHRVFLLSPEEVNQTPVVRWHHRETRFFYNMLVIGLFALLISLPLLIGVFYLENTDFFINEDNENLESIIFTVLFIPAYYIILRWSLILPDSAVDNDHTISWAWNISSGYSFRLFILVGAIPLVTDFVFGFMLEYLEPSHLLSLIENIIWLIVAVIEICLLSLSYEWINTRQAVEYEH